MHIWFVKRVLDAHKGERQGVGRVQVKIARQRAIDDDHV